MICKYKGSELLSMANGKSYGIWWGLDSVIFTLGVLIIPLEVCSCGFCNHWSGCKEGRQCPGQQWVLRLVSPDSEADTTASYSAHIQHLSLYTHNQIVFLLTLYTSYFRKHQRLYNHFIYRTTSLSCKCRDIHWNICKVNLKLQIVYSWVLPHF